MRYAHKHSDVASTYTLHKTTTATVQADTGLLWLLGLLSVAAPVVLLLLAPSVAAPALQPLLRGAPLEAQEDASSAGRVALRGLRAATRGGPLHGLVLLDRRPPGGDAVRCGHGDLQRQVMGEADVPQPDNVP